MRRLSLAAALVLGLGLPAAAHAAPECRAAAPKFDPGAKFAGEVRQVIDGQTLCVGRAPHPETWIRVRLSDLDARQPKARWARNALRRVAQDKYAVCTVSGDRYTAADPVPAICRVAGVTIAGRVKKATER